MPSLSDHLTKVTHNSRFVAFLSILGRCFPDWIITAQFYAALHLIDSYLATSGRVGVHPGTHHSRGRYIRSDTRLRAVYPDYRDLEELSRFARYENRLMSRQDLKDSSVSLVSIRNHVKSLLPPGTIS